MERVFQFLFPVYNWGQAVVLAGFLLICGLLALFSDPWLGLYIAVGGYLGMAINQTLTGSAPAEIEISERDIIPLEAELNAGPFLSRIGDRVWAPTSYQSWWWASDRISIVEAPDGRILLKARRRDLKLLRKTVGR